jgi:hypothetical protein
MAAVVIARIATASSGIPGGEIRLAPTPKATQKPASPSPASTCNGRTSASSSAEIALTSAIGVSRIRPNTRGPTVIRKRKYGADTRTSAALTITKVSLLTPNAFPTAARFGVPPV